MGTSGLEARLEEKERQAQEVKAKKEAEKKAAADMAEALENQTRADKKLANETKTDDKKIVEGKPVLLGADQGGGSGLSEEARKSASLSDNSAYFGRTRAEELHNF